MASCLVKKKGRGTTLPFTLLITSLYLYHAWRNVYRILLGMSEWKGLSLGRLGTDGDNIKRDLCTAFWLEARCLRRWTTSVLEQWERRKVPCILLSENIILRLMYTSGTCERTIFSDKFVDGVCRRRIQCVFLGIPSPPAQISCSHTYWIRTGFSCTFYEQMNPQVQ